MSTCILFTNNDIPKVKKETDKVKQWLEELKPQFERKLKFVYTDSKINLAKRKELGITWDDLPAIAINSKHNIDFAYPENLSLNKQFIKKWLEEVSDREAKNLNLFVDTTISEYFMEWL